MFIQCKIAGNAPINSVFLGRPWRRYGKSVFLCCQLDEHIKPEGWHNWRDPEKEKTAFFAEYNNSGKGALKKNRVSWSNQLTSAQAQKYTPENILGDWIKKTHK